MTTILLTFIAALLLTQVIKAAAKEELDGTVALTLVVVTLFLAPVIFAVAWALSAAVGTVGIVLQ